MFARYYGVFARRPTIDHVSLRQCESALDRMIAASDFSVWSCVDDLGPGHGFSVPLSRTMAAPARKVLGAGLNCS